MTVALVTDSNAQLPPALVERYGIGVVPLTVTLDGEPFLEGVDLFAPGFYDRLADGAAVSTAAPSPGQVLAAYEAAAEAGATEVLSVHIGSSVSATVAAAEIAAGLSPVPVTIVDTGTASFSIGCCVWAAGEVLAGGAGIEAAAAEARRVAGGVGNVFVVGALALAERGGRLDPSAVDGGDGVAVLALEGGTMGVLERAGDIDTALAAMVDHVNGWPRSGLLRVGVGDALAGPVAVDLVERLAALDRVVEVVRYEIGPSVGAHTGAGTVGAVFYPVG
jgi:DegV family protein with EDD domain